MIKVSPDQAVSYDINQILVNTVIDMRLDYDINEIKKANASAVQYKELTLDVLSASKNTSSKYELQCIVDVIEKWKESVVGDLWKNEISNFCNEHSDIISALSASDEGKIMLIIVMEDSTSDNVIEYNGYGLDFIEKYKKQIYDFMILDKCTSNGIEELFSNIEIIYKKG